MAEFFEDMREHRRNIYASYDPEKGARKRRCVLTLVRDEAIFFPVWLRYYSRFFAPEDIYVLDHQTTDGSTDGEGFVRIPVEHEDYDMLWMGRVVEEHQHSLFGSYDVVLVTDVDEIIAPNPEMGTLEDYIDRFDEEFVNCLGYEILHMHETEPSFDPSRPVMRQRSHWFANDGYDKPVLSSGPMRWVPGFHQRADGRFNPDPDFRLIHLHRVDLELCRLRHRMRSDMNWKQIDLDEGWSAHNLITEGVDFERWFYTDSSSIGVDMVPELIPPTWKRLDV